MKEAFEEAKSSNFSRFVLKVVNVHLCAFVPLDEYS